MNGSHERDRSVGRLLRQSRQAAQVPQGGGVTESCLDAETLATWADAGLSADELELALSHVADCARCQAVVGSLARIHAPVPRAKPVASSRPWIEWLVPLAAGTAVVAAAALWIAVPRTPGPEVPQPVDEPRQSAELRSPEPASLNDRDQLSSSTPVENPAAGANGAVDGKAGQPSGVAGAVAPDAARGASKEAAKSDAATAGAIGRNQPGASPAELRRDAARLEAQAQPGAASTPGVSALAAPAVTAAVPQMAKAAGSAQVAARAAPAAGVEVVSPDPGVRWRITGSVVTRSTNGGARWEIVPVGITADLTAGSAPSASVCWVVGRAGVVLLSTDAVHWRRVAFPESTDLSAVRATDASRATVSTADGRTFTTTDAGATWVRP